MTWEILIPIIVRYGLAAAELIWRKAQSGAPPTQQDWDELRALVREEPVDILDKILAVYGIPADSERAQQLRALLK